MMAKTTGMALAGTTGATTEEGTAAISSWQVHRAEADALDGAASARIAALFAEHARLVLGVCRSMLRDATEAEDAAQQTFLSAYGSLLSGTAPDDEAAWLATIARNECRGRIRSRMREPLVTLDPDLAEAPDDAHSIAIRRSEVAALRRALIDLPAQQRRAFVLREFGGLSYEELTASLSVSIASVESLLFRARRQLRERLQPVVSGALSVPFFLRDLLLRLVAGGGESAGPAAKIASLPLAAKLAAAGTGVALVTGGAVGLDGARTHPALRVAVPRATATHQRRARRAAPVFHAAKANVARTFVTAPVKQVARPHRVLIARHEDVASVSSRRGSDDGSSRQSGTDGSQRLGGGPSHANKDDGSGSHDRAQPVTPVEPTDPIEPVTPTVPSSPPPPPVPQTSGKDGSDDSSHDSGSGDSSADRGSDSESQSEPSAGGESDSHGGDSGSGAGDSGSQGGDSGSQGGDSGSQGGDSGSHEHDSGGD
jgi:RNA polymerase sigma-70 factor, ECF subfamily